MVRSKYKEEARSPKQKKEESDVDKVTEDYLTCNGEFSIWEELKREAKLKRIAGLKGKAEGSPSKNRGKHA